MVANVKRKKKKNFHLHERLSVHMRQTYAIDNYIKTAYNISISIIIYSSFDVHLYSYHIHQASIPFNGLVGGSA